VALPPCEFLNATTQQEIIMKKTILILGLATILSASTAFAATTPVACGDMAKQVEAAMKSRRFDRSNQAQQGRKRSLHGKERCCSQCRVCSRHEDVEEIILSIRMPNTQILEF
jgi:hypothetical protein